ncbi:MAG TPA: polysaccharide deacetylase family protein [Thermoanaerobaculia bacterium]|nr:polysaccharide deacetylase family protein [Thermoanaerobaculia bacterium]
MNDLREVVRGLASRMVVGTGVAAAGRALSPKRGALVLYGHRIADDAEGYLQGLAPEWLVAQLEYLTRHFEVIPLDTLVRCYEERKPVPHRSVVLTFDDGFRDNYDPGLSILARFRVPATVFVVTGSLSGGELPWSQRLGYLFEHARVEEARHALLGARPVPLGTREERRDAYVRAKEPVKDMRFAERERVLAELGLALGVEAPRDRMLTWEQAREMKAEGIELGAHTFSHPLLARIPADEARQEIERSLVDLREQLGVERPPFCFPAGSWSPELVDTVRGLGFRSAFLPGRPSRVNTLSSGDAFSMSRVGLLNGPGYLLEAELDGPFQAIRTFLRRRA